MKIMKKIMSVLAVLFLALNVACANEDRPIQVEQLPAAAQKFTEWLNSWLKNSLFILRVNPADMKLQKKCLKRWLDKIKRLDKVSSGLTLPSLEKI